MTNNKVKEYIYIQSRLNNPNFFNPEPLQTDSMSPITEFIIQQYKNVEKGF